MSNDKLDPNVLPEGTVISSGTLRPQDLIRAVNNQWGRALYLVSMQNLRPVLGNDDNDNDGDDNETVSAVGDLLDQRNTVMRDEVKPVLAMYDLIDNGSPLMYCINEPELHEFASSLLEDLIEILHAFIPAGCYVGMHEGDGSLLGVWRAEDED